MAEFVTTKVVFQTWWDDDNNWDGQAVYDTEIAAKIGAEQDYKDAMYYRPGSYWHEFFNLSDAEAPELTWERFGKSLWHMYDDGEATGVAIRMIPVYSLKMAA